MTIGAGFVCSEGVVVAADTKETYGPEDHTFVNKIHIVKKYLPNTMRHNTEAAYAAILGSGNAYLINHITIQIRKVFAETAGKDLAAFNDGLSELMAKLYSSKAFRSYPHSDSSELYTQFLVAARPNYKERASLFQTNCSLVEEVQSGVAVIGCGIMQETAFELSCLNLNMYDSATAALYLIYEAKRHYNSVGGVTHIYSIPSPQPTGHPPEAEGRMDQGLKEALFAQVRGWHNQLVITVGSPYTSTKKYQSVMKDFQKDISRIRKEFRALEMLEKERRHVQINREARAFAKILQSGPQKHD